VFDNGKEKREAKANKRGGGSVEEGGAEGRWKVRCDILYHRERKREKERERQKKKVRKTRTDTERKR
jgi:hypothetical protein